MVKQGRRIRTEVRGRVQRGRTAANNNNNNNSAKATLTADKFRPWESPTNNKPKENRLLEVRDQGMMEKGLIRAVPITVGCR
jgi:hypothetical protein